MNRETIVSPRLQKAVRKLAAEEYYAAQYYMLAPFAAKSEQYPALCELFQQLEGSARLQRFGRLVEWLAKYGVEIPSSESEMKKCVSGDVVRKSQSAKRGEDAGFYLDRAKDIEEAAMKSYKDVIEIDGMEYFTDLQSLLWQNYYDRADNVGKLQTARIALDASCDLVMN